MTEMQIIQDEIETYTAPSTKGLQRLRAEVDAMKDAATMARGIAASGFVPDHWLKDKSPDQAVAAMASAILFGAELGLSAMRSVNELFVVRGKPAMYSRTMAALVRSAGYVIEPVEETPQRVAWKGYRDGSWKFSEWTIERATQAGYTSNKLYQTEPIAMLRAKCIAELCRIAYQDVLLGMDYSIEEINLIDGVTVSRPVKKGGKGLAGLREIAADQAPAIGDNTPPVEEALPIAQEPTADQIKTVTALAKAQGITGKDNLFVDLSAYMQTEITKWSQVTAEDADSYIKSLQETAES
jgi:hypothetical protein